MSPQDSETSTAVESALLDVLRPQPTGGTIVTFHKEVNIKEQFSILNNVVGEGVRSFYEVDDNAVELFDNSSAVIFPDTGVAIVPKREDSDNIRATLFSIDAVEESRPEFYMFTFNSFGDSTSHTWGLQAIGADHSQYSGEGIKLCILDTGLDFDHPDFAGRRVVSRSFVPNETAVDGRGHGTHCAGTAGGRNNVNKTPRYGVAPDVNLYIGKVLSNSGFGREGEIIAGMRWAINQGCEIISMSLGRAVQPGEDYSLAYERHGQLALSRGSLIVAAAGNESSRKFGFIAPVGAPANSPSILAVAAVDQALDVAEFSCGGINLDGGQVDIAAPGVGVLSSVPQPRNYAILRGTSMACPHVAGVAALWAQSSPALRGRALWDKLVASASSLPHSVRDVGAGLVQAPDSSLSS